MPLPPSTYSHPPEAHEAFRRSEQRLRLAMEAGHMGAWDWNIPRDLVSWSPTLERLHGIEPGTFGGSLDDFLAPIHPDDRERVVARIEEAVTTRHDFHVEYRIVRADGALRWLEARGQLFFDDEGEPIWMAGLCTDVTERRRSEEALELLGQASGVLGTSLDSATTLENVAGLVVPRLADWCVIDLVTADGRLERIITAHGHPQGEDDGRYHAEQYPPHPDDDHGPAWVVRTGEPTLRHEVTDRMLADAARDAEHLSWLRSLDLHSILTVPMEARGRILGALTLVSAASQRRYDETDLPLAREIGARAALAVDNARLYGEVQGAVASRDRLLAVVSHDLREPLNTVALSLRLIEHTGCPETSRGRRAFAAARRAGEQAQRLIDDLLDASQIEAGELFIEHRLLDPADLVREAAEAFATEADERGVRIEVTVAEGLPRLSGDRGRLIQVFSNLLRNALKVTSRGGRIDLGAALATTGDAEEGYEGDERQEIRFTVRDTGPGIHPEHLPSLFDAYWQEKRVQGGGVGLGLGIARGIVEAHGGRISVDSRPGEGAAFWFTVPAC